MCVDIFMVNRIESLFQIFGPNQRAFSAQEVIDYGGEAVKASEYVNNGTRMSRRFLFTFTSYTLRARLQLPRWPRYLRRGEPQAELQVLRQLGLWMVGFIMI